MQFLREKTNSNLFFGTFKFAKKVDFEFSYIRKFQIGGGSEFKDTNGKGINTCGVYRRTIILSKTL